jgi:hypothetical protein
MTRKNVFTMAAGLTLGLTVTISTAGAVLADSPWTTHRPSIVVVAAGGDDSPWLTR